MTRVRINPLPTKVEGDRDTNLYQTSMGRFVGQIGEVETVERVDFYTSGKRQETVVGVRMEETGGLWWFYREDLEDLSGDLDLVIAVAILER